MTPTSPAIHRSISAKLSDRHLDRLAVVYVRQSSTQPLEGLLVLVDLLVGADLIERGDPAGAGHLRAVAVLREDDERQDMPPGSAGSIDPRRLTADSQSVRSQSAWPVDDAVEAPATLPGLPGHRTPAPSSREPSDGGRSISASGRPGRLDDARGPD